MLKKHLYIPVEIKPREYVSNLLLINKAIDKNFRCYLGSKSSINRLIMYSNQANGIYFSKCSFVKKEYQKIKKKCDHITILDQELGPALSIQEIQMGLRSMNNQIFNEYIDSYYVLGNFANEIVKQEYPQIESVVKITGWPRIDLWNKYRYLYKRKVDEIKNSHGNFILFSSDYVFFNEKIIASHLDELKKFGAKENDETFKFVQDNAYKTLTEFKKFLKIIKELDKVKFKNNLIIRPHPADDHSFWKQIRKEFKNIKVIYDGDISEWLYASNALLHRGCTTAVQSKIANIPTAYLISDKHYVRESLTYKISNKIDNQVDLYNFMNNPTMNNNQQTLNNYISFNKDLDASEKIAQDLDSLTDRKFNPNILTMSQQFKEMLIYFKSKFENKKKNKKKIIGGIDLIETLNYLLDIRGKRDFKIKKIYNNCLQIEKIN